MPLIDPGQPAPAFDLEDAEGRFHQLGDLRGRPVVLYFYPRDSTPGCTKQACAFRDARGELDSHGAAVFGVSPDDGKAHQKFASKQGLNFPLLIDPGQTTAEAYGVWQEKSMYGKTYLGIVRTTYLIDGAGKVARRWDKVKVKGHVNEIVAAVTEL